MKGIELNFAILKPKERFEKEGLNQTRKAGGKKTRV
jgi:hypothetical protein